MKGITTLISDEKLDILKAVENVFDPSHEAIDTFMGTVCNHHEGKAVTSITYDVHRELAEKILNIICAEAQGIWPGTQYYVAHYQGTLDVGGIGIVIAVSASHRAESFEACRYVIEEIRNRAPVWKQEHYVDGQSHWLPGHSLKCEEITTMVCCGHCEEHVRDASVL